MSAETGDAEQAREQATYSPYYLRPPDHLYTLRSNAFHGWRTGALRDGRQVLLGAERAPVFGADGALLSVEPTPDADDLTTVPAWAAEQGFQEGPIRVRRFWLGDVWCGVEDIDAETEFDEEHIQGWLDDGQFLFYCRVGDFILNRDGGVEAD